MTAIARRIQAQALGAERTVLSLDPGVKQLGWARWVSGQLSGAGLSRTKADDVEDAAIAHMDGVPGPRCDVVVVERMTHYPGLGSKSQPAANDLLDLQLIGAFVAGKHLATGGSMIHVRPHEWKGQAPKNIMEKRIERALSDMELARLSYALEKVPASLQHNVVDAVGIGLWFFRRL